MPPAVEAQSLNHWTAREVPEGNFEDMVINTDCETCTMSGNSIGLRIRVCILALPSADTEELHYLSLFTYLENEDELGI